MFIRLALLCVDQLDHGPDRATLFRCWGRSISGRDLILIIGGLFLIAKATHEIHDKLEGAEGHASGEGRRVVRRRASCRSSCSTSSSRSTR